MRLMLGLALPVLLSVIDGLCWAEGQKIYRIPILVTENQSGPAVEGFKQRMAELGYVEGKNVVYNYQDSNGNQDALQQVAKTLVQQKPDLIVTSSTTATVPISISWENRSS